MESLSFETVERLEQFAMFMENFTGRVADVRSATNRSAREQLEAWKLVHAELLYRVSEQRAAMEQAGDTSVEAAKSRAFDLLTEHLNELDRLLKRLVTLNTEAETIHQRMLDSQRDVELFHDSEYANGVANLRKFANAMRDYLEVMNSRY